jgi:hypothetical protein
VQYAIGFQSTRLAPAVGTGVIATDPQGFEMDGCAGSGCDLGTRSEPFTNPIFANVTMVGNPAEPQTSGGRGIVLRRGHLGFLSNFIVAKWKSFGVSVRDTSVTLAVRDSANIVNAILAENAAAYEGRPPRRSPTWSSRRCSWPTTTGRRLATAASILTNLTPGASTGPHWRRGDGTHLRSRSWHLQHPSATSSVARPPCRAFCGAVDGGAEKV